MAANDLSEIDFTCASIIKNQDGCVCRKTRYRDHILILGKFSKHK